MAQEELCYIHEQLVKIDVLLVVGANQIVERAAGNGKNWLAVALGVVQTIQEVNTSRT